MVNIYIYIVLVQFIYVKTIIIVLSCLYPKFQAQTAPEKRMVQAQLENGRSNKNERVLL